MSQATDTVNQILNAAHGTEKPLVVTLYKRGQAVAYSHHQTHHLAWCAGENWKMINADNTYEIHEVQP